MSTQYPNDPPEHRSRASRTLGLLLVAWLVLPVGAAPAATGTETPAGAETVGSDEARARLAEIEAEIARLGALDEEWMAQTARFAAARESAPQALAAIEAEIAALQAREAPGVDGALPLKDLELELLDAEQALALARKEASELETEAAGRTERRKQIPELLAAAKQRLLAFEAEPLPPESEPALGDARGRLLRARRQAVEGEIEAYEEELRSYDARGKLLTRRRDRATLNVASLGERVGALRDAVAVQRQGEAEVAAEQAQRSLEAVEAMPPAVLQLVRRIAGENRELALRRTGEDGLLQRLDDVSRKLGRADEQVASVTADLELLRRKVEAVGLSGSVGLLLRRTRSSAPDVGKYSRFIRMRRNQISEVQIQQLELVEQRQGLADVDELVAQRMAELETDLSPEDRAAVEALLRDLLETRRRYLDTLIGDTETYFQKLVDFDARQQELLTRTESLLRFIDERVLWIPSGEALSPTLASDARDALAWLFSRRFWPQVPRALRAATARSPLMFGVAGLVLLAAAISWRRIRSQIVRLGEQASQPSCTRIEPTAAALVLSLLLAAPGPGLLAFVGWRLGLSADATQFVRCFAYGLMAASFIWATVLVPRQLLLRHGIAEAHLGWPRHATLSLRRHLGWLTALAVPAVFVIAVFELRGEDPWKESVGRFAFLLAMAGVMTFTHLIFREKGALPRIAVALPELALPPWAGRLLHAFALAVGFGLAVAAMRGYYWTALQLAVSFHVTLAFLFVLLLVHQLGSRWALLASRRLAQKRLNESRIARPQTPRTASDPQTPELVEPEVDLALVDAQTTRLLRNAALLAAALGIWGIWADLLPAAGALRSVELWTTMAPTTIELTNAAGERISSVEERIVAITLTDLLLAVVVGAATLALARNLPGLLEVSMFRQLQVSAGERYAYATIAKYGVSVVGFAAALNVIGVGWANIQWVLAAVGLGLGFGLQEIFANFVSGLIILFERPIRVGDTVTVGEISGTVTRIRIRATWITGFDRKELVVPNKEFITGRLVNWSLSDPILRIEIPVGIAYGSDTDKASRVLREVAEKNLHVLKDPPPYVLFRGFGDSALAFELRVFSPDVAHYIQIVNDLHMEIDRAFRSEGIEIAFPQRDLHVRSITVPRGEEHGERS